METLLTKVQRIEQAQQARITQAEIEEQLRVRVLSEREQAVLAEVRARAEQRGAAIKLERLAAVEAELNAWRQDESRSVAILHESADRNRPQALARALDLFRQAHGL